MSLFLAWLPGASALERLAALRDGCRKADAAGWSGWRGDAQLHITLRFLAHVAPDVPSGLGQAVAAIAARTAPFALSFDRVQAWASALVARPAPSEPLDALLDELNRAAMQAGYARMDAQTPHLTLAYPPRDAHGRKRRIDAVPGFDPALLPVAAGFGEIAIAMTVPGGYRRIAQWPLAGGAA